MTDLHHGLICDTFRKSHLLPDSVPGRHLHKRRSSQSSEYIAPPKRQTPATNMLNGYTTNDNHYRSAEMAQECPVARISNVGNTCFLNSVLYTLRFAPTFLHNLHHLIGDLTLINSRLSQNKMKSSSLGRNVGSVSGPSSRSTSSKDLLSLGLSSDIVPKSKVQVVTEKLHELFNTLHNLEVKESSDVYQPLAFLQAVREANSIFEGNHQQDAHELLVYLLNNIRETCDVLAQQIQNQPELLIDPENMQPPQSRKLKSSRNSRRLNNRKKGKANGAKEPIGEEHSNGCSGATDTEDGLAMAQERAGSERRKVGYNFMAEDFQGVALRRTRCLECESVTERKEPFYDIPVPIVAREELVTDHDVNEIYRKSCVTYEKLCDSNKYLCDNCLRYNEASREVSFEKLPNIMVLQLKRFMTTTSGVQKVNSYMPTPLELECFCVDCSREDAALPCHHRYQLCCVIMHLGATMASGHYISYVKVSDQSQDYSNCTRDIPKGTLSASSSEKSLNLLKFLKPKANSAAIDPKSSLLRFLQSKSDSTSVCKSLDCCGVRLNRNVMENLFNNYAKRCQNVPRDTSNLGMWLECDDENVHAISTEEFREVLSYKQNSTSTPYLLFYSKISEPCDV